MTVSNDRVSGEPSPLGKWPRPPYWAFLGGMVAIVGMGLALLLRDTPGSELTYQTRPIKAWFEDFINYRGWLSDGGHNPPTMAFMEMGDDAVPFLADQCGRALPPLQQAYAYVHKWLPLKLKLRLPGPRPDPRPAALQLLGTIGRAEGTNESVGKPTRKLFEQLGMPAIRKALRDLNLRGWACQAICETGPRASQAVPDLVSLAAADYASKKVDDQVLRAIGEIGAAASNAVPLLSAIAADTTVRGSGFAVVALGDIGTPARPAAPIIGRLLAKGDASKTLILLTAMARIGGTSEEVLPVLRQELKNGRPLCQVMAAVALWNHEPANEELQENINALLRAAMAERPVSATAAHPGARFLAGPLLATLAVRGTDAAVFTPVIRPIAESGDPFLSGLAAYALRQLEPGTPAR